MGVRNPFRESAVRATGSARQENTRVSTAGKVTDTFAILTSANVEVPLNRHVSFAITPLKPSCACNGKSLRDHLLRLWVQVLRLPGWRRRVPSRFVLSLSESRFPSCANSASVPTVSQFADSSRVPPPHLVSFVPA